MSNTVCDVTSIEPLTENVYRVKLSPTSRYDFLPGQYLRVVMGEQDHRPFSIANIPGDDYLELHIGAEPGNQYAGEVLESMRSDGKITIDGGHGNAHWQPSLDLPTVLLAGGTGFSYTYSILQAMLEGPLTQPVFLYWGTRTKEDMYHAELLQNLADKHDLFTFRPVVEFPEDTWEGLTGRVHEAVLSDFVSLEPYQVYIAGRFEMAGVAREAFCQRGLQKSHLFGDAYAFI